MAYDPDSATGGLRKSLTVQIQTIVQNAIEDLNDTFEADSTTSFLTSSPYPTIASTQVVRGDIESIWDSADGAVKISVSAGGFEGGLSQSAVQEYIDNPSSAGGKKVEIKTTVFILFHPDVFRINDTTQSKVREDAMSAAEDWLVYGVLNHKDNRSITTTSKCFNASAGSVFDYVGWAMVENVTRSIFYRGNQGALACWGIMAQHTARIA